MTRQLKPCGTPAAFRRHKRRGEPVDEACDQGWKTYYNDWSRANYRLRTRAAAARARAQGGNQ